MIKISKTLEKIYLYVRRESWNSLHLQLSTVLAENKGQLIQSETESCDSAYVHRR